MKSTREMFVILLFATATFWFTAVLQMGIEGVRDLGYWQALVSTSRDGALFIFSVSFVGPVVLSAAEDKKGEVAFPDRMWFFLAMLFLVALASNFYQRVRLGPLTNSPPTTRDLSFFFEVSVYMAGTAIALRYLAMVYRRANFKPKEELKDVENSFADNYVSDREDDE